jgi:flagellar basal-body rod protein FlgB
LTEQELLMSTVPEFRLFDGMFNGLEGVLDLRQRQNTLTASNIANADTPNYLAKEIPFKQLLSEVMERAMDGEEFDTTRMAEQAIHEVQAPPGSLDGNSVNAEQEALKLTSNAVLYNAVTSGISRRLALLRFAASDGKT